MKHVFPYPDFPALEIPDKNLADIYTLRNVSAQEADRDMVRKALEKPVGCRRLAEQVKPGMRITVVVDDISRSTRTELLLPVVLDELADAGISRREITIFIALGTHRQMTAKEMKIKYTPDVALNYRFVSPDWHDAGQYRLIGTSSRGFEIRIHEQVLNPDFVIGIGQAIPHLIAGFGGGGKIINPGCADVSTIGSMHWLCHEVPEDRLFGVRDNIVRETIDETALRAGLKFIVNEVPGNSGSLAGVFAGDPVEAHRSACRFAHRVCGVKIKRKSDIVIADSYPADIDFWQGIKGLNAACGAVRNGGTVILVTSCPEGVSPQHPEPGSIGYPPEKKLKSMVDEGKINKIVAAHMFLARRMLDKANVILVTLGITGKQAKTMGMAWAQDSADALKQAFARHGHSASINVLCQASRMICN